MSVPQVTAPPWQEIELEFTLRVDVANPYTDVEAWVDFTHSDGQLIRRPAFWDGGAQLAMPVRVTAIHRAMAVAGACGG